AGTFLDDATDSRYIAAFYPNGNGIGLAFTDNTTGAILTNRFLNAGAVIEAVSKIPLRECVYPESSAEKIKEFLAHPLLRLKNVTLTAFRDWSFEPSRAKKTLCDHLGTQTLRGFGIEDIPEAQSASGALLEYLREMNKKPLKHIDRIALYNDNDQVFISPAAHYGLEMEMLLKTLDRTVTAMGRRLFRYWLYHPLKNVATIKQRQGAVSLLKEESGIRIKLGTELLKNLPDIEKSLSRLSCGAAMPRDFLAIRQALVRAPMISAAVAGLAKESALFTLNDVPLLREKLERAINPDMPFAKNEGKVIRPGFNAPLDELRNLEANGRAWLAEFQASEIRRTGINSLKVGFNRVFGFYIEISNANLKSAPQDYIRKQTLTNGERFITQELKDYEHKILTAEAQILKIEQEILSELEKDILKDISLVHRFAGQLATLDVLYSLSMVACQGKYILPRITEGTELVIEDGRHPVVESLMPTEDFIPNDTLMDCEDNHLVILTGPNMAGKSTYIRQNAILVIMAQMGSFIPAGSATIGVVDKIFTRIGAHDEIAKGQSTFMVEMTEAADILNNLSPRSLVILDEIGRGTSTYDGLALAWALSENLAEKKARTLFATHFHELTLLAEDFKGVKNFNVAVKEWQDKVIFLHKIVPGGTDDSYGIYVAKLAGMPSGVIRRAKKVLMELEMGGNLKERLKGSSLGAGQADLFGPVKADPLLEEIRATIESMDVNNLTPIQALANLNALKAKLKE
ncbi:MAG: DNA mismatch repair protein MutS, partial [Candidatus Omnitrophica bacterium]|nr:DNA mismatch repair protein MutS [Candidatus Omnitrophota bacterium]